MPSRLNKYVREHKEGVRWTVIHAGPYVVAIGTVLAILFKLDAIQAPAWSGDIKHIQQGIQEANAKADAAKRNLENLYTAIGKLQRDMATVKAHDEAHALAIQRVEEQMNLLINRGLSGP